MRPGAPVSQPDLESGGQPGADEWLAALPVAILTIAPDGTITRANPEAEQLLNMSERAMTGQPLRAALTPPAFAQRDGQGLAAFDTDVETARAGRLRLDYLEAPLADRPGWRTITLHHAATSRRIGVTADRATGARAAIGAAAMLAHEIKNPLSGIRGAAQLIATGGDPGGDLTRLITTEVDRIAALIDRMQDFTDTRPLQPQPENIYPLLDHARRVALAGFAADITIEERFDPSLPPVLIDRDAFLQVILNLLKNACEAVRGEEARQVVLTTAYRHGMAVSTAAGAPRLPLPIELCVLDSGPGAPADIAEHLFDPFVSGKPEGQGLGLALVDKLVRDMGGIVQYAREGEPEMTVFRLLLPRAPR
ncbi:ATP-binding protein [Hephaestia mangrovi]|uniref:two-component system sensor histidine kinase NtrB n=1 Tax=Hephaestia mangrovi TaxID=2873268 RepID=UPI001CA66E4B|nr:PAS domain-containing protein [Hephaestia mangrovi]